MHNCFKKKPPLGGFFSIDFNIEVQFLLIFFFFLYSVYRIMTINFRGGKMKRQEKNEIYSIRKFKVGVGSALIGLSFLGATGLVNDNFVTGDILGIHSVYADEATPKPEGNVIARGEDGVPWELYENGYLLFKPEAGKDTLTNNQGDATWKREHGEQIKHVGFAGKVYAPGDSSYLFSKYNNRSTNRQFNPTTFDTTNLDTRKVTDMRFMFTGVSELTSLDVTRFDTSKVNDMRAMFSGMSELTNLDVTNFDTRNVTDMGSMFGGLSELTALDVTHFDTSKVTTMSGMFKGMSKLTTLDVTHFDTREVMYMSGMFEDMYELTNLDVTRFNTSNVKDMSVMFSGLHALTALDVTHFNTSNVTDMSGMFSGMSELTALDVTHFDTSNVTDMTRMFGGLHALTALDVTRFDTRNVTNMAGMFSDMSELTNLDVTNFDTSKLSYRGIGVIFNDMPKLKELKLGNNLNADGIGTIDKHFSRPIRHAYGNQYTDKWHKVNDKEHPYTVQDWSDLYRSKPSGTAGTWVREVAVQDATLEFEPGNGEKIQPLTFKASSTPTLPKPTVDKSGYKFKGWTLQDGSEVNLSSLPAGSRTTLVGEWEKVNNVTTRTVKIPVTTVYEGDSNLDKGKQTEIPGQEGEKRITTTSIVTPITGELTNPVEKEEITQAMHPKVIKVGTKSTKEVETIRSPKQYVKDPEREKGQKDIVTEGTPGTKTTTTTYKVNPNNGEVTSHAGEPVTVNSTPTIVKVAAKDKVVTTKIPSPKRYEADTTKDYDTQNVETKGTDGSDVSTTVYTVNSTDGTITENTTKQHTDAIPTIVKVGAKTKVETKIDDQGRTVTETTTYTVNPDTGDVTPNKTTSYGDKESTVEKKVVPSPKRYEKDATREKGDKDIVIKGKDGEDQITTTYVVDPTTGNITPNVGEAVHTIEPTETVIKVAAKDKVDIITRDGKKFKVTTTYNVNSKTGKITEDRTEVELPKEEDPQDDAGVNGNKLPDKVETIKPEVVYEKDATRDKGSENITIPGKDGQKVTPVTKEKDPQTGKLVEKLGEPKITPATNTIVKVAAKDKVETFRHNGDTIERTTRYTVNPETGEITEETIEQLISSNGNGVKPPVVENNDFSGGVSTEPLVNKTSDYKGVIAGNGLDNDGNAIEPPVVTIPEFSGGVNGDVDGNALINEKPEFDLSTLKKPDLGTGLNDFGPKKETKKDDLQFIPVNEEKPSNDFKRSEKPVSQLPNTAGGNNMAINALGALTLASVLGFAVTKRKSEE